LLFSILKFEALDILSTSQVAQLTLESGALNSAALINMVFLKQVQRVLKSLLMRHRPYLLF